MKRYILTAGGSGGHIFPAKSLADQLEKDGHSVLFLTDQRGLNYTKHFKTSRILMLRFQRGYLGKIRLIWDLLKETIATMQFYKELKPDVVIGFGGYPSVPGVLAAQLLRIPTMLHEQNTIMGKANRLLSRFSHKVIGSFAETKRAQPQPLCIGNPVREEFFKVSPYKAPKDKFNLFVVGGSQGAGVFSKVVPAVLKKLDPEKQKQFQVIQQCREELIGETEKAYEGFLGQLELKPFFDNMTECYENAHLVVSRSGGSTVAELCATGRPSLLIPFAASIDGDQMNNAMHLKEKNAAFVCAEYHFTVQSFSKMLHELMEKPEVLMNLAKNAKALSNQNAAKEIAELIYKTAA